MTPEYRIKRLHQLIKDKGFKTQKNLAAALGINKSYLSHLVSGHRTFNDTVARGFEEKLGLTPLYFDLEFDAGLIASNRASVSELNKFRSLLLGETCQLNNDTVATRVVGGWIYTIKHYKAVDGKSVVTESSCFAPFTTQHDLDGMVNELMNKL